MIDVLKDILLALILAMVCAIGAYLLRARKQQILTVVTDLIQKAEDAIRGSDMGEEKKKVVIAQLQAMGIKVTSWLDKQIDIIVDYLNKKGAWLAGSALDTAKIEFLAPLELSIPLPDPGVEDKTT